MKKIFFISLVGLVSYFHLPAQTVFYNQGYIVGKGSNSDNTVIYIKGSMEVADSPEGNAGTISLLEKTRIKLTGDLIHNSKKGNVFLPFESGGDGVVEFCGNTPQQITTSGKIFADIPSKKSNYIDFPNVDINNENHVLINPRLAMKTKNIELSKGWLIVDSDVANQDIDGITANADNESVLAHLLVNGQINYNKDNWKSATPANQRGFIEVRLKLPYEDGEIKSIIGFGSPFKATYTDYFMFNTLLEPQPGYIDGKGFLAKPAITDPKYRMEAGRGYVVGIDLRGKNKEEYTPMEGYETIVDFDQRAKEGYRFNRHAFSEYAPKNQLFNDQFGSPAYQDEELNTGDVPATLQAGYNYLSNPYTCPLSIEELIAEDNTTSSGGTYSEGVNVPSWGTGIKAGVVANRPPLLNKVWILNPNSKAEPTEESRKSKFTYNYQVAMKTGGTYTNGDNENDVTVVAPLQMFLVRAYSTINANGRSFKIPANQRAMGTARFLRNAPQNANAPRRDDFILEFRDMDTKTTDRLSYVLRTENELIQNRYENVDRLEPVSEESTNGTRSTGEDDFKQNLSSQIYTKDAAGKKLTVQFFPSETTDKIQVYHIPSSVSQPIQILGLRINTKQDIEEMWLEDKLYNKMVEITPDMLYQTHSSPNDSRERFVIHLKRYEGIEDETEDNNAYIYAYQGESGIVVAGFNEKDYGSEMSLFDINGKRISSKTVINKEEIFKGDFVPGIYIVLIKGESNKQVKVLIK